MSLSENPTRRPYALTVASSDSGGGAGIQADLKTMTRLGVYGGSVVVAVTAQHTRGVESSHVLPDDEIRAQFEAVTGDFDVSAIKLGMLATASAVETVDDCLRGFDGPVVLDPVMVATSGDQLLEDDAVDAYTRLFERATLLTPNADETERLTGVYPDDDESRADAVATLFGWGVDAVLFKGGHVDPDGDTVRDTLVTADGVSEFSNPRVRTERTHGSGCTLSSAITARLAHGDELEEAVERGIAFTHAGIAHPADVGTGPGSVDHLVDVTHWEDTGW
ncbi:hydroxymethylpyrimidine/phosphomethylpyrimidine kinase [Haloprofundus marisrubri]|uniref:Hydroxymethylpyrimidine/phosphomethylpyrimidine kinase n=1 Tax=Haloprofundus marisrubri TaxID=1514971 RepID=A0A0W1REN4_9EURY|nr:bifunctional hydroxymethylpyrimidine kinase/phosphomethylpyrimidine kinase [Haloprofundus marisrubri]KTG11600.1 hydroxymethylpyrimidine/phosphomethylpyrimidine kinase [Haloprofundus marisrubri]